MALVPFATKHKRFREDQDVYSNATSEAVVSNDLIVPGGNKKAFSAIRRLANCIQRVREQNMHVSESIEYAVRWMMLEQALDWIFEKELLIRIEGQASSEYIKTKDKAVLALAELKRTGSDRVYDIRTYITETEDDFFGKLRVCLHGNLIDTFPECDDIMLGAIKDAEWLASDIQQDSALRIGETSDQEEP